MVNENFPPLWMDFIFYQTQGQHPKAMDYSAVDSCKIESN